MYEKKHYIFYMHPARGTRMHKYLSEFWECSKIACGNEARNDALHYPFHVTLTSFFHLEDESKIPDLVEIAKEAFSQISERPVLSNDYYSIPHISPYVGPRSEDNMSGLNIIAPSVSRAIVSLAEGARQFCLSKKNELHLTLYNRVSHQTMVTLEQIGVIDAVRSTPFEEVEIVLWETDDACSYWKNLWMF